MCYYDENEFQRFKSECLESMNNKYRTVLENWCKQIGYKYPIAYSRNYKNTENGIDKILKIFTKHPGIMIGKAGKNVDLLKEMLDKEFISGYAIEFVEVRGDFINL